METAHAPTLGQLLERGTRARLVRAGLAVLLSLHGLWDRADVVDRWYVVHPEQGAHPAFALVLWDQVAADADRGMTDRAGISTGERAALLLAASLAAGYRVDLAELLPLVDDHLYATFTAALYSTLRGRDPVTGQWDELRFAGQDDRDDDIPSYHE